VRLPRIAIAELMALVVLAATDCWLLSEMRNGWLQAITPGLFSTLLMANVLVIGLFLVVRNRVRKVKTRPFLTGFLAVGAASMVLEGLLITIFPMQLAHHILATFEPLELLLASAGMPVGSTGMGLIGNGVVMIYLSIPQFLGAGIGGLITSRYKIKLVIARRVDEPTDLAPQMVEVVPAQ
jgi:hypothetical protein